MKAQPLAILCIAVTVMCGNVYVWHEVQPTLDGIALNIFADEPDARISAAFAGILAMAPMVGVGLTPDPWSETDRRFFAGCWFVGAALVLGMVFVIADSVGYNALLWPTVAGFGGTAAIAAANGVRQIVTLRLAGNRSGLL